MKKIAVVGAGISGLSMANYLEKHNIDYHIYERRKKDDSAGHGFLIPQEGIEYLSHIIDSSLLFQHGTFLKKYIQYSHKGKILAEKELNNVFVISRQSLIYILSQNILPEKITYETAVSLSDSKKTLVFSDGTPLESDIAIISEGSKSRIRKALFKDERIRAVREFEVVNIIQSKKIAACIENNFMKFHHEDGGLTFGILKLPADTILWYSQFDSEKYKIGDKCSVETLKKYMQAVFKDWHPLVASIIKESCYRNVHLWRVYELEELNSFYENNIVFIGDAAHPLIPFTSQGVTSALKDSFILTKYLTEERNITEALKKYEAERKPEIEFHINNGRALLNQFLLPPDQHSKNILPISYK